MELEILNLGQFNLHLTLFGHQTTYDPFSNVYASTLSFFTRPLFHAMYQL